MRVHMRNGRKNNDDTVYANIKNFVVAAVVALDNLC